MLPSPQRVGCRAEAGDLVCAREGLWRVTRVRNGDIRVVSLRGADDQNRGQPCTLLEPFDRIAAWTAHTAPRVVSRRTWMRAFAALAASADGAPSTASADAFCDDPNGLAAPTNAVMPTGLRALATADIALLPHQLEPVLAILGGVASRLLIADGVGLGKTVEAALVLRTLTARGEASRVLIVVPAGLRDQWSRELRERVGLESRVIDATVLAACVRELPPDINPWSQSGIAITSLDFIKQDLVLPGLGAIAWDVLVVDEAHALTAGTDRATAAHLLARHSRLVLLLTATPHDGSDSAFDALCRIGAGGQDDPIAIFHRTRHTLGLRAPRARRVHVLRVRPTRVERHLHSLLARYVTLVEQERGQEEAATLAMAVLQKRANSSAWSLLRSLERRLALLQSAESARDAGHGDARQGTEQNTLPFGQALDDAANGRDEADSGGDAQTSGDSEAGSDDAGEGDACGDGEIDADEEPQALLGTPGLTNARREYAWLTLLIRFASNAAQDESKLRVLQRLLRRIDEPAIVYTEYRDTLIHIARALPFHGRCDGGQPGAARRQARTPAGGNADAVALLHGALPRAAREESLHRFSKGEARVLLATDAAGEGLNLQQRCRLVINIELPWNPNRLEQRVGRVDRLGQSKTVHAVHLVLARTSEERLLETLRARAARISKALAEHPEPLGAEPGVDLGHEAERAAQALERVRGLSSRRAVGRDLDTRAPWIAATRRHRGRGPVADLAPGLLCVWRTRIRMADVDSCSLHEVITPLHVPMPSGDCRRDAGAEGVGAAGIGLPQVMEAMRVRLDALAGRAIANHEQRERPFRTRARARHLAVGAAVEAWWQERQGDQPPLFPEIAAAREVHASDRWVTPATMRTPPTAAGERAAQGVGFDHALALVLIVR